jgi:hypothetical protein
MTSGLPHEQTFLGPGDTSQKCQEETHAPQQQHLFDPSAARLGQIANFTPQLARGHS